MPEPLRKNRSYILMFLLTVGVLVGEIYTLRRPEPRVITIVTPAAQGSATAALIQVQVRGAVIQPGVYQLAYNARVSNALDSAGGARPEADLDRLNLARKLNDGEAVVVPTRANVTQPAASPSGGTPARAITPAPPSSHARINLNTATVEQLDALPRIGPVLAQRIVDYRNQNGPFAKIEDVKKVKGIGDALFDGIKDLITTGDVDGQ